MTPAFRRRLALLAVAAPALALAQPAAEPPPADGDPDARLWKEPCELDGTGRGELLRVSGSTSGGSMSQGRETFRVQLGSDALIELTQEGRPMLGAGATMVEVRMTYRPVGGALGHSLASLLGSDPERVIGEDLERVATQLRTPRPAAGEWR